jgi:hypothetical protein
LKCSDRLFSMASHRAVTRHDTWSTQGVVILLGILNSTNFALTFLAQNVFARIGQG